MLRYTRYVLCCGLVIGSISTCVGEVQASPVFLPVNGTFTIAGEIANPPVVEFFLTLQHSPFPIFDQSNFGQTTLTEVDVSASISLFDKDSNFIRKVDLDIVDNNCAFCPHPISIPTGAFVISDLAGFFVITSIGSVLNTSHQRVGFEYHLTSNVSLMAATPLPGALPLFASGIAILGFLGRRRMGRAHAT